MQQTPKTLIIGGSSGIGLATAKLLASLGHDVAIASRSKEKLEQANALIGHATTYVLDVTNEEEITRFFETFGPFDHLVTPAAGFAMGPFLKMPLREVKAFFDSKFWGQYLAAKQGAPHIRPGGSITLFAGIASERPFPAFSTGSAINAAIEGLTRALSIELSPIRVNAIAPGTIITPVWDHIPEKWRLQEFEQTAKKLPVKRIGQPGDVAQAVLYLIQCGYATGSIVHVDGGARLI